MKSHYAGIDGCRGGWFCVQLGVDAEWDIAVLQDQDLAGVAQSAETVLIDIPIGLITSGSEERRCDLESRRLLGPKRGSSVFPAPARETLQASDFQEAVKTNRRLTGRGISMQSWAISPKIQIVDNILQTNRALLGVLRECHPEICFWSMNGKVPMAHNKKTVDGRKERLEILRRIYPQVDQVFGKAMTTYQRKIVASDDIIDALVCAVTARACRGGHKTLPLQPSLDNTGLPMEMVYCSNW